MTGLQFTVGAEHAPIVDAAFTPILRRYREAGMRAPADIEALAQWALLVKTALAMDIPAELADDPPVTAELLSLPTVAKVLDCSLTKVKNLIAAGQLRTVDFDGVRRVHRADLNVYMDGLRERSFRDRMTLKEA